MKVILGVLKLTAASAVLFVAAACPQSLSRRKRTHGISVDNIDHSVKPGDDFYHYANGAWIKRTEIPPDRVGMDVWTKLADVGNKRMADLIAEIAKSNPAAGSPTRKIADLYNSYMDEATIEAKGLTPLRPHLDAIAAIKDKGELAHALGESLRADVDALNNTNYHTPNLFGLWVAPGFHDSDHYYRLFDAGRTAICRIASITFLTARRWRKFARSISNT